MSGLSLGLGLGLHTGGGPSFETLALPIAFPVTLRRNTESYSVLETAADFFADYTGSTIHIATDGDDATGDGTSGSPYATIAEAITNASNNDIISMAAGIYAPPSAEIAKDVAFICPSGKAYIGVFDDLKGATITFSDPHWNVSGLASPIEGWIRTDDTYVTGVRGAAKVDNATLRAEYVAKGIPCVQSGGSSANVYPGNSDNFATLVSEGKILAWFAGDDTQFAVADGNTVFVGANITIASNAATVVDVRGAGTLIADRAEFYGGEQVFRVAGTARLIMFGTRCTGSLRDLIDGVSSARSVEVGIVAHWPGINDSDNASTMHTNAAALRVGGSYRGGARVIHDIGNTQTFNFSISVGDTFFGDQFAMRAGSTATGEDTQQYYGDVTFLDTFVDGGITNLSTDTGGTQTAIELTDAWPEFA